MNAHKVIVMSHFGVSTSKPKLTFKLLARFKISHLLLNPINHDLIPRLLRPDDPSKSPQRSHLNLRPRYGALVTGETRPPLLGREERVRDVDELPDRAHENVLAGPLLAR